MIQRHLNTKPCSVYLHKLRTNIDQSGSCRVETGGTGSSGTAAEHVSYLLHACVSLFTFKGIRRWQVSFLHTAPPRALPAAADAAMDADGRALTVPSCGRWGVGGWPGGRGGTCRSGCHLSSSNRSDGFKGRSGRLSRSLLGLRLDGGDVSQHTGSRLLVVVVTVQWFALPAAEQGPSLSSSGFLF